MQTLGQDRSLKRSRKSRERKQESATPGGGQLLAQLPEVLIPAINAWKEIARKRPGPRHKALSHIKALRVELMAPLALRVVLDALSGAREFGKIALEIGGVIEDELAFQAFRRSCPGHWKGALDRSSDFTGYREKRKHIMFAMTKWGFDREPWSLEERASVGTVLLELIHENCGILEITLVRQGKKTVNHVRATEETLEWLEHSNLRAAQLSPMYLPFLEGPLDWIGPMSGGYHSTNVFASSVVKTSDRGYIRELESADMGGVYRAMNLLQRTKWKINPVIFEVYSHLWESGYTIAGLPVSEPEPVPAKPADIETNPEALKAWKIAARRVHDANYRHCSDRLRCSRLHWVCERYQDEIFWFCHQLDWRGRAYPVSYYLQPQGPDLVKALLLFGEGKPVGDELGRSWHAIHGANCWGLDKKPFEERIAWVTDNEAMLRKIAEDPLAYRKWEEADKPWQFLAWCCDWVDVLDDPEHISCLVVHQDATQSGIQIYSLLLRDEVGAEATNCVPTEVPSDLYGIVADRLSVLLVTDKSAGVLAASKWLDFGIDRSLCKRPVMTRVYNATKHSAAKYVQDWVEERCKVTGLKPPAVDGTNTYWYLAERLWDAMAEAIAATGVAQDWLGAAAGKFVACQLPVNWVTPMGLPVTHSYSRWSSRQVKTAIGDKFRKVSVRAPSNELDHRRMVSALAPNYIHSLDAAAMMLTVNKAEEAGITSLTCNHDSFATLAADSQALAEATRRAYVELFSQDLLGDFRDQLQRQLPEGIELPPLPAYGSLDVGLVQQSLYFFS